MKNFFKIWRPIDSIPSLLYCEGIHDDYEGFRILLTGENKTDSMLRLLFESPRSYRNTDEGDLLRTISSISHPESATLFIVEKSSWIEWFHEETYGIHKDKELVHYAIFTPNDCIEVLSEFEPLVEWLS